MRALARTQLFQIDSVNVVARAHYLPAFSRLGAYPRDAAGGGRLGPALAARPVRILGARGLAAAGRAAAAAALAHGASGRAGRGTYKRLARFGAERADYVDAVLREVEARGPTTAAELEGAKGEGGWWGWSDAKRAVEWLFWAGRLTTATRRARLRARLRPAGTGAARARRVAAPTPAEPRRHPRAALPVRPRAGRGDGGGPARLLPPRARPTPTRGIAELVEAASWSRCRSRAGGRAPSCTATPAGPRRVEARALLAPFDPLVWERSRTERLFGVRVRLEIYTPADKRTHGYYVLPFLLGDAIVARVDLKADRRRRACSGCRPPTPNRARRRTRPRRWRRSCR